jgi:ribosomal protein S6
MDSLIREYEVAVIALEEAYEPALSGVSVIAKEGPRPIALAYPVKKHRSGYMSVYMVSAEPRAAAALNDALRADTNILRYLLITPPIASRRKEHRTSEKPTPAAPEAIKPTSPEAVSNEALEAALTDILEK